MRLYQNYLKDMRAAGKRSFTLGELIHMTGKSRSNVLAAIYRQKKEGNVISPVAGLYVIVPPEYQKIGSLPPSLLIPLIMNYWKEDYYVCLLSAGEFYGAAHQKSQSFQVMMTKQHRDIVCGRIQIEFLKKKSITGLEIQKKVVETGYLNISSPEVTAMDLMQYVLRSGGINHVATVLSELIEAIDVKKLIELINTQTEKYWIQRLGYILEKIDPVDTDKRDLIVLELTKYLSSLKLDYIPLIPSMAFIGKPYDKDWKIIENAEIESDI